MKREALEELRAHRIDLARRLVDRGLHGKDGDCDSMEVSYTICMATEAIIEAMDLVVPPELKSS